MAAPVLVVALGPVLAPVAAAGLLAAAGGRDQDPGDQEQVGDLPCLDAGHHGLRPGRAGLQGRTAVQVLQLLRGRGEAVRRAQDTGAAGHDALDRAPGLGGRQRRGHRVGDDGLGARVGAVRDDVGRDALGEHQSFEERVGGQPVGAVHTGARDLAAGVQTGHGRPSPQVGADAAGGVVRGRGDRDRLVDRVDAVGPAGRQDGGEAPLPHLGAEVAGVEVHVLGAVQLRLAGDGLGDDVARGELRHLVLPEHEARTGRVDEVGALAPYRLRHQGLLALRPGAEEEDRGVELDELEVGDLRAGPQCERHTVAGGDRRVGGGREDLAHAAGGEDHRGGVDRADAVVLALAHDVQGDTGRTALGVGEEVEHEGVLDGVQGCRADRLDQGAGDLRTGRVTARVGDAAAVVAALAGQRDGAVVRGVEVGAGPDQPPYGVGALGDQGPYRRLVAQARARDQGVVQVLLGVSPSPRAAAIPPCAQRVEPSSRRALVTTTVVRPAAAQRSAVVRPATPEPTTTTSASMDQPGAGAVSRIPVTWWLRRSAGCCR